MALDAAAIAIAQVAAIITERQARLKVARLSGLPQNLAGPGSSHPSRSGMAPLSKTAQALTLEIRHRAAPLSVHPTVGADGVEDDSTGAAQGALRLGEQLQRLRLLVAVELLVAAQAVDAAAVDRLGAGTEVAHRCVRETVAELEDDRALGPEVERLAAAALGPDRQLLRRVDAALAGAGVGG
jgi:histidine ammonia-lyase